MNLLGLSNMLTVCTNKNILEKKTTTHHCSVSRVSATISEKPLIQYIYIDEVFLACIAKKKTSVYVIVTKCIKFAQLS